MVIRCGNLVAAARQAVSLAPGAADTAELASYVLTPSGHPQEALQLVKKAMALTPNSPPAHFGTLGNAYHHAGEIDLAIAAFEHYHAKSPGFGLLDLAIIHAQNGNPAQARDYAALLLEHRPGFTISAWRKTQCRKDKTRLERDIAALRELGLPE